jgi:hypothetical protein
MIGSIVPPFFQVETLHPLVLFVRRNTLQVGFQTFVDHFCLDIILGVIGCAHVQLGALQFKQLLPKCVGESWVPIKDNGNGHAM